MKSGANCAPPLVRFQIPTGYIVMNYEFMQDANLLAGLRIALGAWQLDLSLAGELSVYAEASGFGQ